MNTDHVFYPPNHLLLLLVLVLPLTWDVLEDDAWLENSLLASTILTVILHSSLQALPQPFQQQPPTSNTVPCTSAELFVSLQCCETQTWVPVNLRAASLPGKLLIKQTGDKLSLLHLCSCIQVSGLGGKSTKSLCELVHKSTGLFIRDRLLSSPLFSSAVKGQDQFRSYLYLDHLIQWREKQHFCLSKVIVDTHLTCDWLWILETWGEHFFAITISFCSSWQYLLLSNINEKSIQIKVAPSHNFVLYHQHRKSLHQVSPSTHLAQS